MALKFWGKNFGERNIVCNPLSKMLQNEVQLHNVFLCHETEFLLKQQFLLQGRGEVMQKKQKKA